MPQVHFQPGRPYKFRFENHRGETETRHVVFAALFYTNSNGHYDNEQWCAHCFDIERGEYRSFRLDRIQIETVREA